MTDLVVASILCILISFLCVGVMLRLLFEQRKIMSGLIKENTDLRAELDAQSEYWTALSLFSIKDTQRHFVRLYNPQMWTKDSQRDWADKLNRAITVIRKTRPDSPVLVELGLKAFNLDHDTEIKA